MSLVILLACGHMTYVDSERFMRSDFPNPFRVKWDCPTDLKHMQQAAIVAYTARIPEAA